MKQIFKKITVFLLLSGLLAPFALSGNTDTEKIVKTEPPQIGIIGMNEVNLPAISHGVGLFNPPWTALQLGISKEASLFDGETALYGLGLQLFTGTFQKSGGGIQFATAMLLNENDFYGVNFSIVNAAYKGFYGIQTGVVNYATENGGAQIGAVNCSYKKNFLQIGLFNAARSGLQIGLINSNQNSILPISIGINYSPEEK